MTRGIDDGVPGSWSRRRVLAFDVWAVEVARSSGVADSLVGANIGSAADLTEKTIEPTTSIRNGEGDESWGTVDRLEAQGSHP
jgi:hypothetical protein